MENLTYYLREEKGRRKRVLRTRKRHSKQVSGTKALACNTKTQRTHLPLGGTEAPVGGAAVPNRIRTRRQRESGGKKGAYGPGPSR